MKQEAKVQEMKNEYIPFPVKVLKRKTESADTFTLSLKWKVRHDPGQFIQISIPGIGEAPISISSYSKDHLDITIRKVGNVTNALHHLKKNDTVLVRGPYGTGYPMEELQKKDLIFVGGGCGVAPLKGVIEYVEKNRKDFGEVLLFLGFRSPGDILFSEKHRDWEESFNMNMSVDNLPSKTCYSGNVGFITDVLTKHEVNPTGKAVFMCGPPIMMQKSIEILNKKGFADSQIYISAERLMYCAFGLCCHCMIRGKFTCLDGPVFRYDEVKNFKV